MNNNTTKMKKKAPRKYGYMVIPTTEKLQEKMIAQFEMFGCDRNDIYLEKRNCGEYRPQMAELSSRLASGDVLVFYSLQSAVQGFVSLGMTMAHCYCLGADVVVLEEQLDTRNDTGRRWLAALGSLPFNLFDAGPENQSGRKKDKILTMFNSQQEREMFAIDLYMQQKSIRHILAITEYSSSAFYRLLDRKHVKRNRDRNMGTLP